MNKSKSKILYHVQAPIICKSLHVPDEFVHTSQEYKEESIIQFFRESTIENKKAFMNSCSKLDAEVISLYYPIDLSLFNEET